MPHIAPCKINTDSRHESSSNVQLKISLAIESFYLIVRCLRQTLYVLAFLWQIAQSGNWYIRSWLSDYHSFSSQLIAATISLNSDGTHVMDCTNICIPYWYINTLRPRQNGRRFADDTFKRIFLNENVRISIKISPKFVPKGPINNIPAMIQIMAWCRSGDKPLSEPIMVSLLTHICVTRPQWVKNLYCFPADIAM